MENYKYIYCIVFVIIIIIMFFLENVVFKYWSIISFLLFGMDGGLRFIYILFKVIIVICKLFLKELDDDELLFKLKLFLI